MKLIFENWNRYLNEQTIEESSADARAYYNISLEKWMTGMTGKQRKQIRAKYRQVMADQARQGAQPAGDQPASGQPAGGQETGDLTVNFIRQLVKMGIYDSLNMGLSAEDFMGNYKAALDANDLPDEWIEPEFIPLVDSLLRLQANLAAKFYGEGDSGAGSQYQAITKFIRTELKKLLTSYKLPPVPEINLWKDDFDPNEMTAMGESVPAKFSNGQDASNKVLSLGRYDEFARTGSIGVLASL